MEENSKIIFNRFLTIFNKIENSNINSAVLNIDKLLWDAFDKIKKRCCANELKAIIKEKKRIQTPDSSNKIKEFNEHKNKLNDFNPYFIICCKKVLTLSFS